MGDIRAFDLQEYVDDYNCWYYVESGSSEPSIDYALRFPFHKVYSLDADPNTVEFIRQRWWFNSNRVQAFYRSHPTAFYEMVRIIPNEFNAVVWLADKFFRENIDQLAQARPAKTDVIIINDKSCVRLPEFIHISRAFGLTHVIKEASIGSKGNGILLVPIKLRQVSKQVTV